MNEEASLKLGTEWAKIVGAVAQEPPNATIYVYRPASLVGMALSPSIYCDEKELEQLPNGTYFSSPISPGKHMIVAGHSEVGLFVDFEPGKQYYFRFGHENCVGTLTQVSEDEAKP